jgi:hypothetical protein
MKQPFRFFRGEFTQGFYLKHLLLCLNDWVRGVLDELVYQAKVQWKLEDEVSADELPMREEDILGIGKIAGLFPLRAVTNTTIGSIYFTPSYMVEGRQRSERGLMHMENESFEFVRTEHDEYPTDIANVASSLRRMSVTEDGAVPLGYVPASLPLFTIDGDIIWENVLPEPPANEAYVPFYGEKYLVHREYFSKMLPLPIDVFKPLLECCQRIRFNGATLEEFFTITRILGQGYIYDLEIIQDVSHRWYNVWYDLNEYVTILNRERRYLAWISICAYKFKLFKLINRNPLTEPAEGGAYEQTA